ncbi:MAG TPA: porphobilinogen synthase, partial [Rhodospirillales bacterium]|nr:porphobilinogen synthase [Rhodospirillales bacterium]
MRRNRSDDFSRRLISENVLTANDLIWSLFVLDGDNRREAVTSMPGVERLSIDLLVDAVDEAVDLGIPAIAVFPNTAPSLKTPDAKEAVNPENLVCRAVRAVKEAHPDMGVICDVALDLYNSDGHDGLVDDAMILNDETVEMLCRQSIVQAQAGCDIIAPSDMMDGRISCIREALDGKGFQSVRIMS